MSDNITVENMDITSLVAGIKECNALIAATTIKKGMLQKELASRMNEINELIGQASETLGQPVTVKAETAVKTVKAHKANQPTEDSGKSMYMQAYGWMPDTFKADELQRTLAERGHGKTRAHNLLTWWKSKDMIAKAPGMFWRKL